MCLLKRWHECGHSTGFGAKLIWIIPSLATSLTKPPTCPQPDHQKNLEFLENVIPASTKKQCERDWGELSRTKIIGLRCKNFQFPSMVAPFIHLLLGSVERLSTTSTAGQNTTACLDLPEPNPNECSVKFDDLCV